MYSTVSEDNGNGLDYHNSELGKTFDTLWNSFICDGLLVLTVVVTR